MCILWPDLVHSLSRCPGDCIASTTQTADEAGIGTGTGNGTYTGTEAELLPLQCSSKSVAAEQRERERQTQSERKAEEAQSGVKENLKTIALRCRSVNKGHFIIFPTVCYVRLLLLLLLLPVPSS